jgi:hypothetical protein
MSRTFNGSIAGQYLLSVSSSVVAPANSSMTYSAWIFPTALPTGGNIGTIIGANNTSPDAFFIINNNGAFKGSTVVGKTTSLAQSNNSVVVLNTWQYVTYVYNKTTGVSHLYVNGIELSYASQTNASPSVATLVPLWVGNNSTSGTNNGFTGSIDSVGIWNTALTTSQITAAMAAGGTPSVASGNLVGYWPLLGTTSPEPDSPVNTFPLTVSAAIQGPNSPGQVTAYSVPDCRNYGIFPNKSRNVNQTLIYDVQTSSNSVVPGTDSRKAGAPVPSSSLPQNSRTSGVFGPGE